VTADAAPVEEAVAEDADAVVPDAEAVAVSAAVDTAQAATNQRTGLVWSRATRPRLQLQSA